MIEASMFEALLLQAPLVALIGDRLEPAISAQKTERPRITYQRVSTEPQYVLEGRGSLTRCRIQYNIFADTMPVIKSVYEAMLPVIDGVRGDIGEHYDVVRMIAAPTPFDQMIPPEAGSEQPTRQRIVDVQIDFHDA